jgi:hypothetical protein
VLLLLLLLLSLLLDAALSCAEHLTAARAVPLHDGQRPSKHA